MNEPKALLTVDEFCRVTSALIGVVEEELADRVAAALASAPAATQGEAVLHALMRSNGTGFVTYDGAPIVSESPVKPFEVGQRQVQLYTTPQPTAPARAADDDHALTIAYMSGFNDAKAQFKSDRASQPTAPAAAPVEAPQQAQPAEHSVALPTNADQAALMSLLGMSWLQEHAPERLRTQPAGPSKDAERLAWIHYHLTGTSIRGTIVNVLSNRSSYAEFIAAIDAARAAQGGKGDQG
jgi:hypothetical protein